ERGAASRLDGSCRCLSPRGGCGSRPGANCRDGTEQAGDVRRVATLQQDPCSSLEAVGDRTRVLDLTRELEALPKMRERISRGCHPHDVSKVAERDGEERLVRDLPAERGALLVRVPRQL